MGSRDEPFNYTFAANDNPTRAGKTVTVHIRGFAVQQAVLDDLLENKAMASATEVVVGGCSAGGLASYQHCDRWANEIHKYGDARVTCLPDAGYFTSEPSMSNWMKGGVVSSSSEHTLTQILLTWSD